LVLGWNFLAQVGTGIKCAGHEIIIPARNRHNGWLEEKLSVAVVQQASRWWHDEIPGGRAIEFQQHDGNIEHGRASDHDERRQPIKQRYYPKNPKVQGEINAKVDELLHSQQAHTALPSWCLKKDGQMETVRWLKANQRQVYKGAART